MRTTAKTITVKFVDKVDKDGNYGEIIYDGNATIKIKKSNNEHQVIFALLHEFLHWILFHVKVNGKPMSIKSHHQIINKIDDFVGDYIDMKIEQMREK